MAKPKIKIKQIKSKVKIIEKKEESLEDEVDEEFSDSDGFVPSSPTGNIDTGLTMRHTGGGTVQDVPTTTRGEARQQPAGQMYQTSGIGVSPRRSYIGSVAQGAADNSSSNILDNSQRVSGQPAFRETAIGQERRRGFEEVREKQYESKEQSKKNKMPWEI